MSPLTFKLDRSSPVPLYYQVAQQIEQAIERGELPPGSRLENEVKLADRHGLSRPTVRQAIGELVRQGLLVRRRGVGTQVVHGRVRRPVRLSSLWSDLDRANQHPTTKVLSIERVEADAEAASRLGVPAGSTVVAIERLRLAQNEPLAVMRNVLPEHLVTFDEQELEAGSLYALLMVAGVEIKVANQRIGARAAGTREAALLQVRRGAPILTMDRTAFDETGQAVEWGDHVYRADSYSFEVTLVDRP
ncbi:MULTISPECIES: GntR family transcriptional regulator [unclassified Frankia]|uniref:GntR family transcriptional regulator n=1 Tax=unclassified Frankia TaxID=2632575 RepID=UPI002AD4F568|nr:MULTISPECIES: GntR family transcriptional regulator [unclassified Frankia]